MRTQKKTPPKKPTSALFFVMHTCNTTEELVHLHRLNFDGKNEIGVKNAKPNTDSVTQKLKAWHALNTDSNRSMTHKHKKNESSGKLTAW